MIGEITFKETQVSYSITGEGPVIVWLHGFMEDKSIWQDQLAVFDVLSTNICIDLLGHGQTENADHIHTMELQAQMVIKVLEKLEVEKYSIIGHSMGGYVGLCLLEMFSEKIKHFVLLNSTAQPDTEGKKINRERALKIVAQQKDSYARMGVINLFSEDSRGLYPENIQQLITIAQKTTIQGISAALRGMMERRRKEEILKNYKGGKLIVAGESDPVLIFENSYKEAKLVGAQFMSLAGGHMSYIESKNQLNEVLKSFFKF